MIDDVPVVNAVAHAYNLSAGNARGPIGEMVRQGFHGIHSTFNAPDEQVPPELFLTDQSAELLAHTHFLESDVDLLVYHVLRLDSLFADGLCSLDKAVELAERWPQRVVTYLGIDPTLGVERCLADLEAQHARLPGAVGVKMYPDQLEPYRTFRMDDPELMFPVYERVQELGLRCVAVHKALPNGPVPLAPYGIDDLEGAAMRFPELSFEIVHAGMAFVPETAYAIARFPNVYANLEVTTMLLAKAPGRFAEVMAEFLFWGGPRKILYSDGALFTHPQPTLRRFRDFQLPEELAAKHGLAPLTVEDKALMLSGNYARIAGLDLDAMLAAQADDEFARARRENGGLREPFTAWKESGAHTPAEV
ncbi:MAG TPA: amidohydrolase family protein [Pseudonocardia sp.]|nr:amidohydrolase family protein [Pseudonocardia sp.]